MTTKVGGIVVVADDSISQQFIELMSARCPELGVKMIEDCCPERGVMKESRRNGLVIGLVTSGKEFGLVRNQSLFAASPKKYKYYGGNYHDLPDNAVLVVINSERVDDALLEIVNVVPVWHRNYLKKVVPNRAVGQGRKKAPYGNLFIKKEFLPGYSI